jgi:hypothetical protein
LFVLFVLLVLFVLFVLLVLFALFVLFDLFVFLVLFVLFVLLLLSPSGVSSPDMTFPNAIIPSVTLQTTVTTLLGLTECLVTAICCF